MGNKMPERTCIGCSTKRPKKELIRLAKVDGNIVIETTAAHLGRGAYLCSSNACFEMAAKRRMFQKTLSIGLDEVGVEFLAKEFRAKIRLVGSETNA